VKHRMCQGARSMGSAMRAERTARPGDGIKIKSVN